MRVKNLRLGSTALKVVAILVFVSWSNFSTVMKAAPS